MKKLILLVITLASILMAQTPPDRVVTCTTTGSANAYICTPNPAITAYTSQLKIRFISNFANSGAATIAISGLAAVPLVTQTGGVATALAANYIRNNVPVEAVYVGTNFYVTSVSGIAPAGGGTIASTTIVLKGDNAGNAVAATAGTDFACATSGTALLKGNGSGCFSNAAAGTDYVAATSGSAIQKANGSGGLTAAAAGTDYVGPTSGSAMQKANGSGGLTAATAGTDYGTPDASTKTLTNTTLDAEGTGNVITMPAPVWLAGGVCQNTTAGTAWDLPTTTPAVATCVTGTNIQKGVLAYADTSGGFAAQTSVLLPVDWTTATAPSVDLIWSTSATTGNAKWTVQFGCTDVAATATDDPAFPASGNGFNTITTAAPGTANRVQTSTISAATLPAACTTATKEFLHIRVFRDGNDAADTITATANLIGVMLTVRRAM